MMIAVAMILRVYAMYNRSRIILGVLLVMYTTEIVILFVSSSIYSDPNYATGAYQISRPIHAVLHDIFPYSVDCATARHHTLQHRVQHTDVEQRVHDRPVHSRHRHVRLGDGPVREALTPDVSSDAEMAVEQIHESPRQRQPFIFPRVRPPRPLFLFCWP